MAVLSLKRVARSLGVVKLTLDGQEFKAQPLSADETAQVLAVFPQPVPPMGDDPDGGSAAPKIPRVDDPGYRSAFSLWQCKHRAAVLAVGICKGDPAQLDGVGPWANGEGELAMRENRKIIEEGARIIGAQLHFEVAKAFEKLTDGAAALKGNAEGN